MLKWLQAPGPSPELTSLNITSHGPVTPDSYLPARLETRDRVSLFQETDLIIKAGCAVCMSCRKFPEHELTARSEALSTP